MIPDHPPEPSRAEIEEILVSLIEGRCAREDASEWAAQWICVEDPSVEDPAVWKVLTSLVGADMISTDRPYLYDEEDFQAWLDDFRSSP